MDAPQNAEEQKEPGLPELILSILERLDSLERRASELEWRANE